jgi:hypothetical protein
MTKSICLINRSIDFLFIGSPWTSLQTDRQKPFVQATSLSPGPLQQTAAGGADTLIRPVDLLEVPSQTHHSPHPSLH